MKKKKFSPKMGKWSYLSLASLVIGGLAVGTTAVVASESSWVARTASMIKADIKGDEYTIKWGDTLSAISEATGISVNRLAAANKIQNIDLIYAGNVLVFGHYVDEKTGESHQTIAIKDQNNQTQVVLNVDDKQPLVNKKATEQAKIKEQQTDNNRSAKTERPQLPVVDKVVEDKLTDVKEPKDSVEKTKEETKKELQTLLLTLQTEVDTKYTLVSWVEFQAVFTEALAVLENEAATQQQLNQAITSLNQAQQKLVLEVPGKPEPINILVRVIDENNQELKQVTLPLFEGFQRLTMEQLGLDQDVYEFVNLSDERVVSAETLSSGLTVKVNKIKDATLSVAERQVMIEQELYRLINEFRLSLGLNTLQPQASLQQSSQIRSTEIQTVFEHVRPNGQSFKTVINEVEPAFTNEVGEVLVRHGFRLSEEESAQKMLQLWRNSPDHYRVLTNPNFKYMGLSVQIIDNDTFAAGYLGA